REIFRGRPADFDAAVQRHTRFFNSHPYLAGVALGAVARLEAEGAQPSVIDRFKSALRGSLGSLGDRLIWAGLRPACGLLAIAILFAGAPWWLAVLAFLVLYNIGHIALRIWGFRLGLQHGKGVGEHLRRSHFGDVQSATATAGAFLLGFLIPIAATGGLVSAPVPPAVAIAAFVAAAIGLRFGNRLRTPVAIALAGFALFGLVYEAVS
ncbi:MAG: PTS system mannose/fructose/sorbose family transporter subunit IID, partial [Longimicrobiales bacterium]